jgi:hypothetical protein
LFLGFKHKNDKDKIMKKLLSLAVVMAVFGMSSAVFANGANCGDHAMVEKCSKPADADKNACEAFHKACPDHKHGK